MNELVENGKTLGEYIKMFVDTQGAMCCALFLIFVALAFIAWFMWVNYFNSKDDK